MGEGRVLEVGLGNWGRPSYSSGRGDHGSSWGGWSRKRADVSAQSGLEWIHAHTSVGGTSEMGGCSSTQDPSVESVDPSDSIREEAGDE